MVNKRTYRRHTINLEKRLVDLIKINEVVTAKRIATQNMERFAGNILGRDLQFPSSAALNPNSFEITSSTSQYVSCG